MDEPLSANLNVNRVASAHPWWRSNNVVAKVSVHIDRAEAFASDCIDTVIVLAAADLAVSGGGKFYFSRYRQGRDVLFFFDTEISEGGFQISNIASGRLAFRSDGSERNWLDER